MIKNNLFLKKFGRLAVLAIPTISMVTLTAQKTLAIPLAPVLDQMGRQLVERSLDIDSSVQAVPPATQSIVELQQETDFPPEESTSIPANTQEVNNSSLASPAYYPPNYPPQAYPAGYAAYPLPNYPQAYPPGYAAYPLPNYPQAYPPGYATYPPARSSPPIIINNF